VTGSEVFAVGAEPDQTRGPGLAPLSNRETARYAVALLLSVSRTLDDGVLYV
jgi:hypothetical protein